MAAGSLGGPAIAEQRLPRASAPVSSDKSLSSLPEPAPPLGATELQAASPPSDVMNARRLLDQSSIQSNRIRAAWRDGSDTRRKGLAATLADLESASAIVRDDIERLDVETRRDPARLDRFQHDVALLKQALDTSYKFAPPASSGLPQPSPTP
jgi:hypothetical protein